MNKEILTVVDVVSNEKSVDKEIIFEALEAALASATKKRYSDDIEVRVAIDRESGAYEAFRQWEAIDKQAFADELEVEDINNVILEYPDRQIWLADAEKVKPGIQAGEFLEEPLEAAEFGRIAAQTAKQVIVQKVREAERAQVVEAFQDRYRRIGHGRG